MATADQNPPDHEHIAICAYLIWEKENRPEGRDREIWYQAETQLRACHAHEGSRVDRDENRDSSK